MIGMAPFRSHRVRSQASQSGLSQRRAPKITPILALLSANAVLATSEPHLYMDKVRERLGWNLKRAKSQRAAAEQAKVGKGSAVQSNVGKRSAGRTTPKRSPRQAFLERAVESLTPVRVLRTVEHRYGRGDFIGTIGMLQDLRQPWRQLFRPLAADIAGQQSALAAEFPPAGLRRAPVGRDAGAGEASGEQGSALRVVAYVTNSVPFTQSGYALRTHQSLQAMRAAGVDVVAATRFGYPFIIGSVAWDRVDEVDGVRYHRLYSTLHPRNRDAQRNEAVRQLVALGRAHRAQAILTTTSYENALVAASAAQILGVPWVYELRGEPHKTWLASKPESQHAVAEQSEFYLGVADQEDAAVRAADAVAVLGEVTAQRVREFSPGEPYVVPNAIDAAWLEADERLPGAGQPLGAHPTDTQPTDAQAMREQVRAELGIAEFCAGATVVGTVSSLVAYEGLDFLLRAVALRNQQQQQQQSDQQHQQGGHIAAESPRLVKALIVGAGSHRTALEALARELNIEHLVKFVGKQPFVGIDRWYRALDVFVVPRRDDYVCRTVTPIKALMAQALGVPVIASDLEALREVTGGFARFVPPEDAVALASAIDTMMEDIAHGRAPVAEAAWLRTRTWDAVGKEYRRMFEDIIWRRDWKDSGDD